MRRRVVKSIERLAVRRVLVEYFASIPGFASCRGSLIVCLVQGFSGRVDVARVNWTRCRAPSKTSEAAGLGSWIERGKQENNHDFQGQRIAQPALLTASD